MKWYSTLIILSLFMAGKPGYAQYDSFNYRYDSITGMSIKQTFDGGYVIGGHTGSASSDLGIMKLNIDGSINWGKVYSGMNSDFCRGIVQTSDSGFLIAANNNTFDPDSGDVLLIKTDFNGDTVWTKTFGTNDKEFITYISKTQDGGFIISGAFGDDLNGVEQFLMKIDSLGSIKWTRKYLRNNPFNPLWFDCVVETSDRKLIITGQTRQSDSLGFGLTRAFVIKTDSAGEIIWNKIYGSRNRYERTDGFRVLETFDGNYVVSARYMQTDTLTGTSFSDVFLYKIDTTGTQIWTQVYSGVDRNTFLASIFQSADSGFCLFVRTGVNGSAPQIIKTNSDGDTLWVNTYNHGWATSDGLQSDHGGYILVGSGPGTIPVHCNLFQTDQNGEVNSCFFKQGISYKNDSGITSSNFSSDTITFHEQNYIITVANQFPILIPVCTLSTAISDLINEPKIMAYFQSSLSDILVVNLTFKYPTILKIYNLLGEEVIRTQSGIAESININTASLCSGIYLLVAESNHGIQSLKFLKY